MPHDVYSYGMIASSCLYILRNPFPLQNGYAEIQKSYPMIGGEAANSSLVLRALGVKVKIDGTWLEDSPDGLTVRNIFQKSGVDISRLIFKKNYTGAKEIIFSYKDTKTIFGTYQKLAAAKKAWNIPQKKDIAPAKVICLDPFFGRESLLVSQYARRYKIPYVTVDCKHTDLLFKKASLAIISREFQERFYHNIPPEKLFKTYQKNALGLVVFTAGNDTLLFARKNENIRTFKPYKIHPIDTTGAGDAFRAGMIYGLLKGWDDNKSIVFSSALASFICLNSPGVLNAPGYAHVKQFIKKQNLSQSLLF